MPCAAPKYVAKKGKTPVLNVDEARALLDALTPLPCLACAIAP